MTDPVPVGLPRVLVKPGKGVRVPLPIPGAGFSVPKDGREVVRDIAVERLIISGDLVVQEIKADAAPATDNTQAADATAAKKG